MMMGNPMIGGGMCPNCGMMPCTCGGGGGGFGNTLGNLAEDCLLCKACGNKPCSCKQLMKDVAEDQLMCNVCG
jgi:hypothetical protein